MLKAREGSDIDLLIVSSNFETLNTRERLELLGVAAARLWQPIEAVACTLMNWLTLSLLPSWKKFCRPGCGSLRFPTRR